MPLLVKIFALLRLLIVSFCRFLTLVLMTDKSVKEAPNTVPTSATTVSTTAVLARRALDRLATDGCSEARDIGYDILAPPLCHNLLVGI